MLLLPRIPYPPISGYNIKNLKLIEILSRYFLTHTIIIADSQPNEAFLDLLRNKGVSFKIFIKPKFKSYVNVLTHAFSKKPIQIWYHYFRNVQEYVDSIADKFDVIISAGNIRMCEYVKKISNVPKILDLADLYSFGYQRNSANTKSLFWKLVYKIEASRLYNYEKEILEDFDKVFLFSEEEVKILQSRMNKNFEKVEKIPHGVDEFLFNYSKKENSYKNSIVFVGKMDYQPNVDAVMWFSEEVLPLLSKDLSFIVVGANPTRRIMKMQDKYRNVVVTGYVEDPFEIINSSLCFVAPMKTGSGIQNKVLQAMALGKVCIVTDLAAKPIGGEHLEHLIIANTAKEFAYWIEEVVQDPEKYSYIGVNARKHVVENFTWKHFEDKILQAIYNLLNNKQNP